MRTVKFEELKRWIIKRQRSWTLLIEDDKIRLLAQAFIIDWRTIRDMEKEMKLEITDVIAHATLGVVILFKDLDTEIEGK